MNNFISKQLIGYYLLIMGILAVITISLAKLVTELFILAVIFGVMLILITIIFIYITRVYINPLKQLSRFLEQILTDQQRLKQKNSKGSVGKIFQEVNNLAENIDKVIENYRVQARQLLAIIEHTENGLLLIDEVGFILYVNRKFTEIIGGHQGDYKGKRYYDALDSKDIQRIIKRTFFEEDIIEGQTMISHLHLNIIAVPILSKEQLIRGTVLAVYDVTQFKQLDTMRRDFVANVSHELKTPITSIKGFAETLLTSAPEDYEAQKHFLQIILSESERMQQLIEQLLLLSKMERENPELELTNIDMVEFIQEIEPLFIKFAKEKNIQVNILIDDQLQLQADRQALTQVIVNVMMNAIIYTSPGGRIQLVCRDREEYISLMIEDTGIGIPEDKIPRIFERFYRVDEDRSRDSGGTGLGLSIVKHIVEAHKGKIVVQSELNKGTIFTFFFPKENNP